MKKILFSFLFLSSTLSSCENTQEVSIEIDTVTYEKKDIKSTFEVCKFYIGNKCIFRYVPSQNCALYPILTDFIISKEELQMILANAHKKTLPLLYPIKTKTELPFYLLKRNIAKLSPAQAQCILLALTTSNSTYTPKKIKESFLQLEDLFNSSEIVS
jgi:hypothetical protein